MSNSFQPRLYDVDVLEAGATITNALSNQSAIDDWAIALDGERPTV